MPAPAYNKIQGTILGSSTVASLDPGATAGQPGNPLQPFNSPPTPGLTLTGGTALGQFNLLAVHGKSSFTVAEDVDLSAVTDPFGTVVNLANVYLMLIQNLAVTDAFNLTVGGAGANPWVAPFNGSATGKLTVPPGAVIGNVTIPGELRLWTPRLGQLLVSGTSKVLHFDPGANNVPYNLQLWGLST